MRRWDRLLREWGWLVIVVALFALYRRSTRPPPKPPRLPDSVTKTIRDFLEESRLPWREDMKTELVGLEIRFVDAKTMKAVEDVTARLEWTSGKADGKDYLVLGSKIPATWAPEEGTVFAIRRATLERGLVLIRPQTAAYRDQARRLSYLLPDAEKTADGVRVTFRLVGKK